MPKTTREKVIALTELSNGIPLLCERMPHVRSVAFGVWINSGSRHEAPADSGISHFLEHMLFKGTHSRSAEQIAREVDSIGGHLDAFTGKELVGYTIKVLDEHLPKALDVLSDLVLHPLFQPDDVAKEKGVILEELKMELDNPEYVIHEAFMEDFWRAHPLGTPIIGTRANIRGFSPDRVAAYHRRIYTPGRIVLTAAGNLQHDALRKLAERHFGSLEPGVALPAQRKPRAEAPFIVQKKRWQQVQLCLGVPAMPVSDPRRYAAYVLNTLLGGGMSSRLFQNIRERQGLAYSVYSELSLYQDAGSLAIYAGVAKDATEKVVHSILSELRDLMSAGVPDEELQRAKDHMKGSLVLGLESTGSRMSNLARQHLYHGRVISFEEMLAGIEAVTARDVKTLSKQLFGRGQLGLALLGPVDRVRLKPEDLRC